MSTAAPLTMSQVFQCGPVRMELFVDTAFLNRLSGELLMFDLPFDGPSIPIQFQVCRDDGLPPPRVNGDYLNCHRFKADRQGHQFLLLSHSGAWCRFDTTARTALVFAPASSDDVFEDVEQFLIFALVWGWRAVGWTPLHVATIERNGRCALICAESCGGKSTFTAACIHYGFRTLGDDKVLINTSAPPRAFALSGGMNLDPAVSRWFPETATLAQLPTYSRWSPKRKVRIESLWPDALRPHALPVFLLKLNRSQNATPLSLQPLPPNQIINALSRQTVIPNDRQAAAAILPTIMRLAAQMRGWSLTLSSDVYTDLNNLQAIEELFA